ncbi:peptidoglycan-binding protein [Candidatus Peregrinibacteria bacterium]|nr:peptidoglycan-binding protein [Candidatus Peregrinibacteria bacterium]
MERKSENKNLINLKFWQRILGDFVVVLVTALFISPFSEHHGVLVEADEFDDLSYPYEQTFVISAYYSPLPCQNKYVTGSYEGDIRLNGGGVRGADGTPVFPGMIAAPRTYDFGTKIYIPGVGITEVHDRGGAIVTASNRGHVYDRLDIWMGYGDKGLKRALGWGKRTVNSTVYGPNDDVAVEIILDGYSSDEANANDCSQVSQGGPILTDLPDVRPKSNSSKTGYSGSLSLGMSGNGVLALQTELTKLNFFKGPITGFFGDLTKHSVFKFQQSQNLVKSENDVGAGIFGPRTKDRLNEIMVARNYRNLVVGEKKLAVGQ